MCCEGLAVTRRPTSHDLDVLLIDGNNFLHRTTGGVEPAAQRSLIARLRAALPSTRKVLVFDGHRRPEADPPASPGGSLEVRYAGGPADEAIVARVSAMPFAARAGTVVVTDDRALADSVRSAGARTQRLDWLVQVLERPSARRPAGLGGRQASEHDDDERTPWRPGRGATRKTGNPRRAPRRRGDGAGR